MKKIIAFGDSVLKGTQYNAGRYSTASGRFTDIIEECLKIKIENKARMGATVTDLEKMMDRFADLLADTDFDTVMLEYGGNDSDFNWDAVAMDPAAEHICRTPIDKYIEIYCEGISKLQTMGKRVLLLTMPPIASNEYFSWVSEKRNGEAILQWLKGDINHMAQWQEMFCLAGFKIAAKTGATVMDITSPFFTVPHTEHLMCSDGIHPNLEGHKLIADAIIKQLSEL